MSATLLALPASHPALAAELMLRHKKVNYRRIDLLYGAHRGILRALGYPGITVPALRLSGGRVQGTKQIALALDALRPESPLLPGEGERRAAVEASESWGDELLQPVARRVIWAALTRDHSTVGSYLERAWPVVPTRVAAYAALPVIPLATRLTKATDENVRQGLAALPALIAHVDELLEAGTIGGPEPNVADFQIATSVSLLLTMEDMRPYIEGRPAELHARALVGHQPGSLPPALPAAWLSPHG
jgi:glutathione S-transferase